MGSAAAAAATALASNGVNRLHAASTRLASPGDPAIRDLALRAVDAARSAGITTWALTGAGPNPLTECVDDYVAIDAQSANAQEGHLIALHAICRAFDAEVHRRRREEQR